MRFMADDSNRDLRPSSNWGHVEGFASTLYYQYQTASNGGSKIYVNEVNNEWPTVGLGRVHPAAGFR
ncbi:hypothetical protein FOYG_03026 [Fusarium oxysporum NRRL 32931]|uniref:Uncharacterized protein n=1 Tax=Fusarium oxysporum NRRL 32931 TaxID=660029 RepID=W9IUJ8_FUSOX|nr:hypothetical protein FOYG_03026 [Fusarium oxysporum NRRL 32931]